MDARHREMIHINIPMLVEKTENIDLVIDELASKGAISVSFADSIKRDEDPAVRAKTLYCALPRKGSPDSFHSLIEVFHETGNESVALLLKDNRLCNQSPTEGMSPSDEDDNYYEETYRMKSDPRGGVLLINVFDHDDNFLPTRDGSQKDMMDLKDFWEKMGFFVQIEDKGTKKDIEEAVIKWRSGKHLINVDCGVIMIMAHGREVSPDSGTVLIDTRDKQSISSEWIVKQMNSSDAHLLHGRPKLIFILTCRGDQTDQGLDLLKLNDFINATPQSKSHKVFIDPFATNNDHLEGFASGISPFIGDILLIYPCAPGNASSRDPENGSWFVQTMIDVFSRKAHKDDVETMLKEMDRELIKKRRSGIHDSFQVICTTSRGFKKKLFFRPKSSFTNGNVWGKSFLHSSDDCGSSTLDVRFARFQERNNITNQYLS